MAERRMFAKKVVDSDAFLDMPASAQNLYFHLGMRSDDDGFINSPKRIRKICGASNKDLKMLIDNELLIEMKGGIMVIRHWHMNNQIRKDRYTPTQYSAMKKTLSVTKEGIYIPKPQKLDEKLPTTDDEL